MSGERLRQLMGEATEGVGSPELADAAWQRAGGVRRRRLAVGSAAAVVAVVSVVVGVVVAPGSDPAPAPTVGAPTVTTTPAGPVVRMPEDINYLAGVPLPRRMEIDPATVGRLSDGPVGRADAVFQPSFDTETATVPGPVYAYANGRWILLDQLDLVYTHDADNNKFTPMRAGSLSPDGRLIAFPQPEQLIVVDLTKPEIRRIPVPGLNEHVFWAADGRSVLVGEERRVVEVTLSGGQAAVEVSPWDLVAGESPLGRLELAGGGFKSEDTPPPLPLTARFNGGTARPIDQSVLNPWGLIEWYGQGWLSPDATRVTRSGWITSGSSTGMEGVAAMSISADGAVAMRRLLAFGFDEQKGCCETLGWSDDHTVLVLARRFGVIRWDVTAGTVTRVTDPFGGLLSLRDLTRG